ncbi:MAG: hypothetical protein MZV65_15390 [Chromatiales bacterium]|nr:hypothetical protein [Chromatiales bacterium]
MILALALGPVALAGTRCQIEQPADARQRLEVWGRELAGARGPVTAHATRHVAIVQARGGAVLEALLLVTLQETGAPARPDLSQRRPRWVRCTGGGQGRTVGGRPVALRRKNGCAFLPRVTMCWRRSMAMGGLLVQGKVRGRGSPSPRELIKYHPEI